MNSIMVIENKGQYQIHPNADPEVWQDVLDAADNVEFIESLLGWGDYKSAYKITADKNTQWYFVLSDIETVWNKN